jgi:hypothetical protein
MKTCIQDNQKKFKPPTRKEICDAVEAIRGDFFNPADRDFEERDFWQEYCLTYLLRFYLDKIST